MLGAYKGTSVRTRTLLFHPCSSFHSFFSVLLKSITSIMGDTLPGTNRHDLASLQADPLYAAIRTQANFLEITPWALVLAAIVELNGAKRSTLNYALATLFVLRVWHGE